MSLHALSTIHCYTLLYIAIHCYTCTCMSKRALLQVQCTYIVHVHIILLNNYNLWIHGLKVLNHERSEGSIPKYL